MQSLIAFATVALFCIVVNGQTFGVNEDDLFHCFDYIICDIRNIPDFRKVIIQYKPRAMEHAIGLVRDNLQLPEAANNDETWDVIPDRFCALNDDDKKRFFGLFGGGMTDFWGKVCEEGAFEECEAIETSVTDFNKLIARYLTKGLCGTAAKAKGAMKLPGLGR